MEMEQNYSLAQHLTLNVISDCWLTKQLWPFLSHDCAQLVIKKSTLEHLFLLLHFICIRVWFMQTWKKKSADSISLLVVGNICGKWKSHVIQWQDCQAMATIPCYVLWLDPFSAFIICHHRISRTLLSFVITVSLARCHHLSSPYLSHAFVLVASHLVLFVFKPKTWRFR